MPNVPAMIGAALMAASLAFAGGQTDKPAAAAVPQARPSGEAPMLKALVEAGKLPPLEQRIPEKPYVVQVVKEIGQYGGTLYGVGVKFSGLRDTRQMIGMDRALWLGRNGVEPGYAEFEAAPDALSLTLRLRKGIKWSDGHPFSADDILFWYEDVILEKDLTRVVPGEFRPGGQVMKVVKVDDLTVRFEFAAPHPTFVYYLAHDRGSQIALPKHYLSRFHKKYLTEEQVKAMIAGRQGAKTWYDVFNMVRENHVSIPLNEGFPTIGPYMVERRRTDGIDFVRNPYYWKVDTAGNQLPYIDRVRVTDVQNIELFNAKVVSGEVDLTTGFQTSIVNLPLYKQGEQEGKYDIVMWETADSADIYYLLNPFPKDPVLRPVFFDKRFRQAISLAVNRKEIIDVLFFGIGEPVQTTVIPESEFYEPRFAKAYVEYDPERANRLLDEMGLKWDARREYRLRPDGSGPVGWTITYLRQNESWVKTNELMVEYWKKIGLDVRLKEVGEGLYNQIIDANDVDMVIWHADNQSTHRFIQDTGIYTPYDRSWKVPMARPWNTWFATGGKEGVEPPAEIKELGEQVKTLRFTTDPRARIAAAKKILEYQAEHVMALGIARIPKPVVRSKHLGNVPDKATLGWDYMGPAFVHPSQYYLKPPRNRE